MRKLEILSLCVHVHDDANCKSNNQEAEAGCFKSETALSYIDLQSHLDT